MLLLRNSDLTSSGFLRNIFSKAIILLLCCILIPEAADGQMAPNNKSMLNVSSFFSQLEDQHKVSIFYKTEWFDEDDRFHLSLLNRDLKEALSLTLPSRGLEFLIYPGVVVIFPSSGGIAGAMAVSGGTVIIGDPNEYGRFNRATISGEVRDGASGEPLPGAVIFESESGKGVTTNVDGKFSLELPVGDYRLRISYIGFEEAYQSIRLISNGKLDFDLFRSISLLEQVTITAMRARENIISTRMSVIQMDARVLKELPQTFGERDIVRSVTLLPGIQTIGEFGTGFNVRGGSADQNLILIENVPLFNSSHLFGLISVVNPDMVSDVTLMKAGIPARYGERASSVMDIKLSNGNDMDTWNVTGGIGVLNSRLLLKLPIVKKKLTFTAGARSSYSDYFLRQIPDEDLLNSNAGFYDITSTIGIRLGTNSSLALFGYYSFDRFGFSEENQYRYGNTMGSVKWSSLLAGNISSNLTAAWSNYFFEVDDTPFSNPSGHFSIASNINYAALRWNMNWQPNPDHSVSMGFNGINYRLNPGEKLPIGDESVVPFTHVQSEEGWETSIYLSDDYRINEKFSVDAGLRYTLFLNTGPSREYVYAEGLPRSFGSISDSIVYGAGEIVAAYGGFEPRIGLRYQLAENTSVKASYNRSAQYINLISNTSVMSPTDLWKLSDRHIKPLVSDQFAVGYFHNFKENTIETSVEAYYRSLTNALEYRSGAEVVMNPAVETDLVNAQGYGYGLEFYVKKNSGRFSGWTSYTWSRSLRQTTSPHAVEQINNNVWFPSNFDRPHNLVINASYNATRRWRMGATFTYNTGRPVTLPESVFLYGSNFLVHYSDRNKYRLPDYHRLDISISMGENHRVNQRGKGFWTFTIMNVYARKNPYSVFYRKDPSSVQSFRSFNMYQMYIIGTAFPTLTYNFSF